LGDCEPTGVGAIVEDVTERKRLERAEAVLSAELQHRVKNILAKVQAAATLTLKSSKSLKEFEEAFSGRLSALVRAHDALFRNQWQPTLISVLVHDALAPYRGERQVPLFIADIRLPPKGANIEFAGSNNSITWTSPDGKEPVVRHFGSGNTLTVGH
jgi:two-component sensor histidine kinase